MVYQALIFLISKRCLTDLHVAPIVGEQNKSGDAMKDTILPTPLYSDVFKELEPGIRHGFFTRLGGVSNGIYNSLNVGLGSDDDRKSIEANRVLVCKALGGVNGRLATVYQHHSADVVVADHAWQDDRPKADALVTKIPGLVIGILTADCGPILFADQRAGVVGVAHAGWKGAKNGVLENTIEAMIRLGARRENIIATLGPCISQKNYEVGPEFEEAFVGQKAEYARYFLPSSRQGHTMFDLTTFIVDRLNGAGVVGNAIGVCTYGAEDQLYSYRRSTHKKEPDYGRQISAIVLHKGD